MSRCDQFIPHLVVSDGMVALKFYQEVFGAKTGDVMMEPQGTRLMHGEIILDGHMLFLSDEFAEKSDVTTRTPQTLGGTTARIERLALFHTRLCGDYHTRDRIIFAQRNVKQVGSPIHRCELSCRKPR